MKNIQCTKFHKVDSKTFRCTIKTTRNIINAESNQSHYGPCEFLVDGMMNYRQQNEAVAVTFASNPLRS